MKKSLFKKIISAVVATTLLTSALSCFTVSAEEKKLILGDANLDGRVSIEDATAVQKYLAGVKDFNVRQEVSANVDNTKIDVSTVTVIQKYLADYEVEYALGSVIDEGEDGIIVKKAVDLYYPEEDSEPEKTDIYFSTKYNDIPFMTVNKCMAHFMNFCEKGDIDADISDDGSVAVYQTNAGTTVEFNYNEKYIEFSDYDLFTAYADGLGLNAAGDTAKTATSDEPTLLLISETEDHYYSGDPYRIKLDNYSVPMLKKDTDLLIPVATFSDAFISNTGYNIVFNGEALFSLNPQNMKNPQTNQLSEIGMLYYSAEKKDSLSEEMTLFNYGELCLNLDLHYGLKEKHNIRDFDSYFSRMGLKKEYLSGDVFRIEKANNMLCTSCFSDFHSAFGGISPFLSIDLADKISANDSDYYNRISGMKETKLERSKILGEKVQPYERRGNTVFITFDQFVSNKSVEQYFERNGEYDLTDTVELFAYALNKLQNEDKDAENVVIDIACNGGGTVFTCYYAICAIIGKASLTFQNPNTNALHKSVVTADLNLDGKIDENDISIEDMGKNVAIITTDGSFSCGNLMPCNIKYRSKNTLMLGQRSGGGACIVHYSATATGSFIQISGGIKGVTMNNGYIKDIDEGVAPDIYLSKQKMFDRDYITELVNASF